MDCVIIQMGPLFSFQCKSSLQIHCEEELVENSHNEYRSLFDRVFNRLAMATDKVYTSVTKDM